MQGVIASATPLILHGADPCPKLKDFVFYKCPIMEHLQNMLLLHTTTHTAHANNERTLYPDSLRRKYHDWVPRFVHFKSLTFALILDMEVWIKNKLCDLPENLHPMGPKLGK